MKFLHRQRQGPVPDGLDLPLVHLDPIHTEVVAEELDRGAVEFTLLELQVEVVFPELPEDLRHVMVIFGQVPGVDQNIVNVHDDKPVEELPEHLIHKSLEDGRGFGKAIRHNPIFIVA